MLLEIINVLLILWFCYGRLAELQKHGEEDWKKKVPRLQKKDSNEENNEKNSIVQQRLLGTKKYIDDNVVNLRPKPQGSDNRNRSVSLVDRMNQLQNAQNSWQSKVGEKDAEKFTVAGKMKNVLEEQNHAKEETPKPKESNSTRAPRTPKPKGFKSSPPPPAARSPRPVSSEIPPTVEVAKKDVAGMDHQDIDSFFASSSSSGGAAGSTEIDTDDFDLLSPEYTMQRNTKLTNPKKAMAKLRPQTKKPGSKNPVKNLMQRTDLVEVEEELPDVNGTPAHKKSAVTGLAEKRKETRGKYVRFPRIPFNYRF